MTTKLTTQSFQSKLKALELETAQFKTFKAIVDRATVGTAIIDLGKTYSYVNKAFARMHG